MEVPRPWTSVTGAHNDAVHVFTGFNVSLSLSLSICRSVSSLSPQCHCFLDIWPDYSTSLHLFVYFWQFAVCVHFRGDHFKWMRGKLKLNYDEDDDDIDIDDDDVKIK